MKIPAFCYNPQCTQFSNRNGRLKLHCPDAKKDCSWRVCDICHCISQCMPDGKPRFINPRAANK